MTSEEILLQEMLVRFTNPNTVIPDNIAMQEFVNAVKNNSALVPKAHDLIVEKIRSANVIEADRAVWLLNECMSGGGIEFQRKTAKYEFLNKLIAMVQNPKAPNENQQQQQQIELETKKRIMECLMLWTIYHTDKPKIQRVFDSLKDQVGFSFGPLDLTTLAKRQATNKQTPATAATAPPNILGKDDQLVAKLLKEGGAENFKKANLLIQRNVMQDARRTELICHLKNELKSIENTMEVLAEMLINYGGGGETIAADSVETIKDLYQKCSEKNEQMARWPDILENIEPRLLEDILTTKDTLMSTLQRYRDIFEKDVRPKKVETTTTTAAKTKQSPQTKSKSLTNSDILSQLLEDVDLNLCSNSNVTKDKINTKSLLLDDVDLKLFPSSEETAEVLKTKTELLGDVDVELCLNSVVTKKETERPNSSPLATVDELSKIFGNIDMTTTSFDILKPISVYEKDDKTKGEVSPQKETNGETNGEEATTKSALGFKELREIDKISEEMFKQSLHSESRQATFKREPEKITLNDLAKDKKNASLKSNSKSDTTNTTDEECKITSPKCNDVEENLEEKLEESPNKSKQPIEEINETLATDIVQNVAEEQQCAPATLAYKPLADIAIDLYELSPLPDGERLVFEDGDIKVSLKLTSDRPSANVSVMVMSVSNKSKLLVSEFQFEASVKKPCKVRLLPATDTKMAPEKPFRPTPIHQVILLLNPTQKPVDLTCVVGYKLGDDPDPIKEPIVAKNIPFVV